MNLYMIRRKPHFFVPDAFDFAIVAAENGHDARHTHPARGVLWIDGTWSKAGRDYSFDLWAHPQDVRTRLLGVVM